MKAYVKKEQVPALAQRDRALDAENYIRRLAGLPLVGGPREATASGHIVGRSAPVRAA